MTFIDTQSADELLGNLTSFLTVPRTLRRLGHAVTRKVYMVVQPIGGFRLHLSFATGF